MGVLDPNRNNQIIAAIIFIIILILIFIGVIVWKIFQDEAQLKALAT